MIVIVTVSTSHAVGRESLQPYVSFQGNLGQLVTGSAHTSTGQTDIATSSIATLSGLPTNPPTPGQIKRAYLYWEGSCTPADYDVTLDGIAVSATRQFTHDHAFSAFADVTELVQAKGNGVYTFADLTVDDGSFDCKITDAASAAWSLVVIYEDPALPDALIQLYDGFVRAIVVTVL